ncbi:MAG: hypothetical protein CSA81_09660 [Acidobacteria bacterium]|nr:MAG: hypothetical protein CSA81_09660 [Acidobacteriota bacterium]
MAVYFTMIFFHILGATIWVGGLFFFIAVAMPKADNTVAYNLFKRFKWVAISALFVQLLTGLHLAYTRLPSLEAWFAFQNPLSHTIVTKLVLLVLVVVLGIDAFVRVIPKLKTGAKKSVFVHLIVLNIISVLYIIVGILFKKGGI